MRLHSLLPNLILLVCSLAFLIGGLEFALRLTGIDKGRAVPPPIYVGSGNPDISYQLKASISEKAFRSTIVTNAVGFRSNEVITGKPTIAILGDSIAFGYGVENDQMISAAIQKEFPDWNVLNTGVPGYNLHQESATYQTRVTPLSPRALVIIFHPNDLQDMTPAVLGSDGILRPAGSQETDRGCDPIQTGILGWIPGKCWLDTHSAIYRTAKKVASARTEKENLKTQEQAYKESPFDENIPVERVQDYGRELDQLVATLPPDFPRLFVIWPEKYLHFVIRPQLKELATSRGFKVLDLYEVFGNNPETLGWDTVHPSANTATTAGTIIAETLKYYGLASP